MEAETHETNDSIAKNVVNNIIPLIYQSFCQELINSNRYITSDLKKDIEGKIDEELEKCQEILPEGTTIFRARIATRELLEEKRKLVKEVLLVNSEEFKNMNMDAYSSMIINNKFLLIALLKNLVIRSSEEEIKEIENKLIELSGFEEVESGAPTRMMGAEGRANPKYISYLYTALEEKTAITEVRPHHHQFVSLAEFKLQKDITIIDLRKTVEEIGVIEMNLITIMDVLNEEFSSPIHTDIHQYLPLQYACEYIKLKGYDGIIFNSSLTEGSNLVFFDKSLCKFVKSKIVKAKVEMEFEDITSLLDLCNANL